MGFLTPDKPKPPPAPPNTPTRADAQTQAGPEPNYATLIATGQTSGLRRKASTAKRTLIGGSGV
jgi:hypothetical protein